MGVGDGVVTGTLAQAAAEGHVLGGLGANSGAEQNCISPLAAPTAERGVMAVSKGSKDPSRCWRR